MPVTDPVADMLTRIRNALVVKKETVEMPASKVKTAIADILLKEGFIKGMEVVEDGVQGTLKIKLKYSPSGERVISDRYQRTSDSYGLEIIAGVECVSANRCDIVPKIDR